MAGQVQAVLDRHGHTMERAGGELCGGDPIGCIGGAPCCALQEQRGGVQPAVHLVDAFKASVYHLPAGHLTVGDMAAYSSPARFQRTSSTMAT